jgi:tape measure domain-containing protein
MAGVLEYALSLKTAGFDGPLKQSEANLRGLDKSAGGAGSSLGGLAAGFTGATAVVGAFAVATAGALSVLQSYAEFDGLVRGLKTIEGTAADTQARLTLLRDVAKLPGLGFEEAVRGDIRLRAVGLSAQQSENILRSFGNAIATVGGGKAELDGVILALGQIQSKGKISTEEINQLAERVPQVRAAIKDAFGTSDIEALGKSTLTTTQFIDGLTESIGKLPKVTGGAQNTLDNYNDSWKQLKTTSAEFAVGISSTWIDSVSGAFQQASRDLNAFKEFFGVVTPGLGGTDGAGKDIQEYRKKKADKLALDEAAAAAERAVATANEAFWQAKGEERAENEKKLAEERTKIEAKQQKDILAAQEKVFAARLSEAANIERQIAALKSAGPSGAPAINGAKDLGVKSAIAERTAEIVTLEKRLAEVRAASASKEESTAKAAEAKAEAAAKEIATQSKASSLFEAEGALLEAKANKQTKLVATLERQAKVEALKLELMDKQGLAADEAAAAAEKRIALEERVAKPRKGVLDAAASAAARLARRSAGAIAYDERKNRTGGLGDSLGKFGDLGARLGKFGGLADRLSPDAAAAQLARGSSGADPGKSRREERKEAQKKAENPLLAAVNEIKAQLATLTTA